MEAAKLLLPRAALLERTELANELDAVAIFHYPGTTGWGDLDAHERQMVQVAACKRIHARREANRAMRHQRLVHEAVK